MNTLSIDDLSDESNEPILDDESTGIPGEGGEDIALNYVKEMKDTLSKDDVKKYSQFLINLRHLLKQKISLTEFVDEAKELFKGHDNLVLGLNQFLPTERESILANEAQLKIILTTREDLAVFMVRLKERLRHNLDLYALVVNILCEWVERKRSSNVVYQEVVVLLQNNPDLVPELRRLMADTPVTPSTCYLDSHPELRRSLPDTLVTSSTRNKQSFDLNLSPQIDDDHLQLLPELRRSLLDTSVTSSTRNKQSFDLNMSPQIDDDHLQLLSELRRSLPDTSVTSSTRNKQSFDLNMCPQIDDDHLQLLPASRTSLPDTSVTSSTHNKHSFDLNMCPQLDDDHLQLLPASRTSLPDNSVTQSTHNKPRFDLKKDKVIFLENVKERLSNTNDYDKLMEYLYHYSTEIFTKSELRSLVDALLGKHPVLMERFHEFLDCCEKDDGYLAGLISKKAKGAQRRDKQKSNRTAKSREDVNVLNCKKCTPSYRLLPDDYPILPASYKSELDAKVLNDQCILPRASGGEGHCAKNPYEAVLHKCESDRFEADMFLEYVGSTIQRLEEFLDNIDDNTINSQSPVPVEDYLTVHNISCIKRLYYKCVMDIMGIIRENPVVSLRVILYRLKQRKEEWTRFRTNLNKVWAKVYAKNHEKSLDHRSLYFKKQDAVNLSNKFLLAEIKENQESGLNEDDQILAIVSGKSRHFIQNLNYDNSDNDIHKDLHKLILDSCKKVCSKKDGFNKVTKLWTTFIEPMLGLPSRPYCIPNPSKFGIASKISYDLLPSLKGSTVMKCSLLEAKVNDSKQKGNFAIHNDKPKEKHKEDVGHREFDRTVENEVEADVLVGRECPKLGARPLALHIPSLIADKGKKDSRVFYGNDHFYTLFRLHQILYERILSAKMICTAAGKKGTISKDTSSINPYARFMSALNRWLGGYIDDQKFEGACLALMGNKSYNLFTLNELITKLSKQLETVATDKMDHLLLQLYEYEKSRRTEKYNDTVYHNNARLSIQKKNLYQFEFLSSSSRLTIKLMDTKCQIPNKVSSDPNFPYLNEEYLVVHFSENDPPGLMLRRNMRKYAKLDELSASLMAMEDVKMVNNLEYTISSKTSKITFVPGTEDFFYRKRKKTKTEHKKNNKSSCVHMRSLS